MKIATIIGARPQFIKASAVSRLLSDLVDEVIIHTGQHYDFNLSRIFFDELEIPEPKYHLGVGSGSHGAQTGDILIKTDKILIDEMPDWVMVYGDTNSTLAGALAATKLHMKIAHIEAGLRSFNRRMPEEINRILTDHMSDVLFCPSEVAIQNLAREGIKDNAIIVGDVMADSLYFAVDRAVASSSILNKLNVLPGKYFLATVHRAENTGSIHILTNILTALANLHLPVIFPIHPRTRTAIENFGLRRLLNMPNIRIIDPLGYVDMIQLEQSANMILTDSGGIQKEAYWLKVPCITLRDETEWVETVETGWNVLVGTDTSNIIRRINEFQIPESQPPLYGNGEAAQNIVNYLLNTKIAIQ